jgi:hypothetical protein
VTGSESDLKAYLAQSDTFIREGRWMDERHLMTKAVSKFPHSAEIAMRFAGASAEVSPGRQFTVDVLESGPDDGFDLGITFFREVSRGRDSRVARPATHIAGLSRP